MFSHTKKSILLYILIAILILLVCGNLIPREKAEFIFAEENLAGICELETVEQECQKIKQEECRKLLEKCEEYYRKESERISSDLNKTEKEKKTLENAIYSLNQKIKNLNYQIYQSNLIVKDLKIQIEDTTESIGNTSLKIEDSKEKLANLLRIIYEEDQKSIIEVLVSEPNLSEFFDNLAALEALNQKSKEFLQDIKILKSNLEQQKDSLDDEKGDLEHMVKIQTSQKEANATAKNEQEYYLKLTEEEYQKYLKEKEETDKKAAEIRARIFELVGVPEAPTFGEALDIAKYVEGITGIRPAFLLAILTQESNIGKNVGQCYLKNSETGEGVVAYNGKAVSRVMKPMGLPGRKGDVEDFLKITGELGRDPYNTPVSCPMSYGWGGAMGPAQFIPTTWKIYKEEVKKITGKPADPWNIKDAFLAAALYLADYGATKKTYNAEWKASMIYFSGTSQRTKYNGWGFYGDAVMKIATDYENDIKAIEAGN